MGLYVYIFICSTPVMFVLDLMHLIKIFSRITPFGEPPTPRAAHVATAVGTMVVIQVVILINAR